MTRRPTYGDAVLWLAQNDEVLEHDDEAIAGLTTTLLAADLFGVEPRSLATDVLRARHGAGRWQVPEESRCRCQEKDDESWADDPERYVQHTPETCPGRPCADGCDHRERRPGR